MRLIFPNFLTSDQNTPQPSHVSIKSLPRVENLSLLDQQVKLPYEEMVPYCSFMGSFFKKHLLNTYYMTQTVVGAPGIENET